MRALDSGEVVMALVNIRSILRQSTGNCLQVGERGVAGAEVVDGDLDPELLDGSEPPAVVSALRIRAVSVTSMISDGGVEVAELEGVADVVDDGVVVELAARDVDRDVQRCRLGHARPPSARQASIEHPVADLADLAGLFEDRDELVGLHHAPGRMLPAQECLDADQGEVVEVVDGLVDEAELVALESASADRTRARCGRWISVCISGWKIS